MARSRIESRRPASSVRAIEFQKTFHLKVIKSNKKCGNTVPSRRALLEKEREDPKRQTLDKL